MQLTFDPQSDLLQSALLQHMFGDVAVLDVLEKSIQRRRVDDCGGPATQSLTHLLLSLSLSFLQKSVQALTL